jgi:hypothetical protein
MRELIFDGNVNHNAKIIAISQNQFYFLTRSDLWLNTTTASFRWSIAFDFTDTSSFNEVTG